MTTLILKGSLFDEEPLGTLDVESLPEAGDVLECQGKSFTVTDLMQEDGGAVGAGEAPSLVIAIVEPLAVSQRRGAILR